MKMARRYPRSLRRVALLSAATAVLLPAAMLTGPVTSAFAGTIFTPGDLLVSTGLWTTNPSITSGTTELPPNCGGTTYPDATCATANAGGQYPQVFNNDAVDGSFGVSEPIVLDELNPTTNAVVDTLTVPNSTQAGVTSSSDQLVTSFSSKSELALNQSTDGQYVNFMGYVAPSGSLDVSNADTPGAIDPTNTDSQTPTYRAVAQLDDNGNFVFTETSSYSGNNGRAAIEDPETGTIFMAGNGGNGSKPEPKGVVVGTGSQLIAPSSLSEATQTANYGSNGSPLTPYGNFSAYGELGLTKDKTAAKDDNFRGMTINNNVVYLTKGSGSNGVDTVYYVDTVGGTCPSGSGVPSSSATLPSLSSWTPPSYYAGTTTNSLNESSTNPGLTPTNMCVLNGFPTALASGATDSSDYPFGIWFANPTTLYVADEGAGDNTYNATTNLYTAAAASTTAGLQKWSFNGTKWVLDYVLQNGLNLGTPYPVASNPADSGDSNGGVYPTTDNTIAECPTPSSSTQVDCPFTPATDGLRNLTGQVNSNGTVTIWAATSTVSGAGDQGADPNQLVDITDNLAATTLPVAESFSTAMGPTYGQVVRGVSFTPGTGATSPPVLPEAPWVPLIPLSAMALGGAAFWQRSRRRNRLHPSI
jgi:hypothetical protein